MNLVGFVHWAALRQLHSGDFDLLRAQLGHALAEEVLGFLHRGRQLYLGHLSALGLIVSLDVEGAILRMLGHVRLDSLGVLGHRAVDGQLGGGHLRAHAVLLPDLGLATLLFEIISQIDAVGLGSRRSSREALPNYIKRLLLDMKEL